MQPLIDVQLELQKELGKEKWQVKEPAKREITKKKVATKRKRRKIN